MQDEIIKEADGIVVMNYSKGIERMNIEEEMEMAYKYGKSILTAYELQPVGEYGLEEYNTYNEDDCRRLRRITKSSYPVRMLALHSTTWI